MSIKSRFEQVLKAAKLNQTEFAARSGYSRAALSNFLNDKTRLPKADFFQAVKKAFPPLNLDWLITGQGDMWEGAPPTDLQAIKPSASTEANQELLNRLLVQKLEEVARDLKENDPEAYRRLRLDELTRRK